MFSSVGQPRHYIGHGRADRPLVGSEEIDQLCVISPVYAFITKLAEPIMERASAMILLVLTPTFCGHPGPQTTRRRSVH